MIMPRSKSNLNPTDLTTVTKLASGAGVVITKDQHLSKIINFKKEIIRKRSEWIKKMNDDTYPLECKLKVLENKFIANFGSEELDRL